MNKFLLLILFLIFQYNYGMNRENLARNYGTAGGLELGRLIIDEQDLETGYKPGDRVSPSKFGEILETMRLEYNDIKRTEGRVVCVSSFAIIISVMAFFAVLGHIWASG